MLDGNNLDLLPTPEAGDNYISAEVLLPLGGVIRRGKVISCKRDADGNTVGRAHEQPILDTRTYDVVFNDGMIKELMTNEIAECMYAQCDPGGNQYVLLDCFVDFEKLMSLQTLEHVWLEDLLPIEGRLHNMGVPQGPEGVSSTRDG